MRRTNITAILLSLLALALPSVAAAQSNSGLDQYEENLPGAAGSQPTQAGPVSEAAIRPSASVGLPDTSRRLKRLGPDGRRTVAAAKATAPSTVIRSAHAGSAGGSGSGPGIGLILPVVLVVSAAGAIGLGVMRQRAGQLPGAAYRALAAVVVFCGAGVALALPSGHSAGRTLTTGFADFDRLASADPSSRATWLDQAVKAGAGIVRFDFYWASVAPGSTPPLDPSNPASASYDFSRLDPAVRDAEARGLSVTLSVTSAPPWAEAPGRAPDANPGTWMPSSSALGDFMRAVAARYTGNFDPDGPGPQTTLPAVQAIQIWNEPNLDLFLTPQFQSGRPVSPSHYREMLNAAYNGIKSVNSRVQVVTAGLAPYGDPPGGTRSTSPVTFWRDAFCIRAVKVKKSGGRKRRRPQKAKFVRTAGCSQPVRFDDLAHHPINTSGPPTTPAIDPNNASSADLGRIVTVLRGAERLGTVQRVHHEVWADEMWFDSNPPNPVGVSLATQARYLEQEMFLVWKAGATVAINQLIRDVANAPTGNRYGYNGGLFFEDGRPKPALTAFRFPFVTQRLKSSKGKSNSAMLLAWGKSPVAGSLAIQRQQGGHWRTVKTLSVSQGSVFTAKLALRGKQRLRAVVNGEQSLVWKQAG
jgi:hypothetical protein